MNEERLAELESRYAFQDDTIAALNDVVVRQQAQIDGLARELRMLRDHVMLHLPGDTGAAEQEIPPHY